MYIRQWSLLLVFMVLCFLASCLCHLHAALKIQWCCHKDLLFTHCCLVHNRHDVNTDILAVSKMFISMKSAARTSLELPRWKSWITEYENVQLRKLMPVFQSRYISLSPSPAAGKISESLTSSPTLGFVNTLIFAKRHLNFCHLSNCKVESHCGLGILMRLNIFLSV